jgi:predicted metal-dependent hydrolase
VNDPETEIIEEVVVKRSRARKKTAEATLTNGTMRVLAPEHLSQKDLEKIIAEFRKRFERREFARTINREGRLLKRAKELNRKYFGGGLPLRKIEYSVRQTSHYGTCCPESGRILINSRLREMPQWVEDYIIVHELAHLIHPDHGTDFWRLVRQYPKTERAIGYLIAKGMEEE